MQHTQSSLKMHIASPSSYDLAREALRAQRCVILPTETVYGLAARADSALACEHIYALKGRAFNKPLPLCVLGYEMAQGIADISPAARALMDKFWPGPLTLVLPLKPDANLSPHVSSPAHTVALRSPDCGWARHLKAQNWPYPLALTSANLSGAPSPVNAQQAALCLHTEQAQNIEILIDDGTCAQGVESTIIELSGTDAIMLREGALCQSDLKGFDLNWRQL